MSTWIVAPPRDAAKSFSVQPLWVASSTRGRILGAPGEWRRGGTPHPPGPPPTTPPDHPPGVPWGRVGKGSSDPTNDDDDDVEVDVEVEVDGDVKRWRRDSVST